MLASSFTDYLKSMHSTIAPQVYCLILYSKEADKFYVGHTCDEMTSRLQKHNSNHKGFTGRSKDWVVVYSEIYSNKSEAYARERKVKKWKSRVKIEGLVRGG